MMFHPNNSHQTWELHEAYVERWGPLPWRQTTLPRPEQEPPTHTEQTTTRHTHTHKTTTTTPPPTHLIIRTIGWQEFAINHQNAGLCFGGYIFTCYRHWHPPFVWGQLPQKQTVQ
jgi:hypothetical protein